MSKYNYKEFQQNGQNINRDILTAKLDGRSSDPSSQEFSNPIDHKYYKQADLHSTKSSIFEPKIEPIKTKNSNSSSYPIYPQQPIIDWYFIKPSVTYYQDLTTHNELNYSTQKIIVNVINDNSSSIKSPKSILKSNNNEIISNKRIYTSPNTIIGSQTMEDLFQVVKNQRLRSSQSTSMVDRVIIIDRYDSNSPIHNQTTNKKEQLHTSTPMTTSNISITPLTGYMTPQPTYYNTQQQEMYTLIPNNIYLTTAYAANAISYYPFVYYQY